MSTVVELQDINWHEIANLTSDLRRAADLLGQREARYLVDTYYQIQDFRIAAAHRRRKAKEDAEPNALLGYVFSSMQTVEKAIASSLGRFARRYTVGAWAQSICGIGPVISAGLLAHFDIRMANTASRFVRFAGLDPTIVWEKKQKRPYNAALKTLIAFKLGESFVKTQNRDSDFYGKIFAARKLSEWQSNLNGKFSDQASAKADSVAKNTTAYKWYSGKVDHEFAAGVAAGGVTTAEVLEGDGIPMLPPAHIHARARRYAVKLFVSHLHHVMYEDYYEKEPPVPYAFNLAGHGTREDSFIPPPNWPLEKPGVNLKELLPEVIEED